MRPSATSWADQILSNRVCGIGSAPAQPGRDDRDETGGAAAVVLEVMGQVGVEGDAVAGAEEVALAVDDERDLALEDDGRLPATRLVERRIAGTAGARRRRQLVQRDVGALTRQGRRQLLGAMPPPRARSALAGADD